MGIKGYRNRDLGREYRDQGKFRVPMRDVPQSGRVATGDIVERPELGESRGALMRFGKYMRRFIPRGGKRSF